MADAEPQDRNVMLGFALAFFVAAAAMVTWKAVDFFRTPSPEPLVLPALPKRRRSPRQRRPADPRLRLLAEWEELLDRVPAGQDELAWLSRASGMPFRAVDRVRQTRNRVAHADGSVSGEEIRRALEVVARTRHGLNSG